MYALSSDKDSTGVSFFLFFYFFKNLLGYVKVHAVGMHNSDKTQIWISTYKYPKNANNTYALEYEYGRIFREEKEVELIGVSSEWKTSPYSVYVYYKIASENGRAKLMTTFMDSSSKTTMYYFTPKLG